MKNKYMNTSLKVGKEQLERLKNMCIFAEETAKVVYDDELSAELKVDCIRMYLERYVKK